MEHRDRTRFSPALHVCATFTLVAVAAAFLALDDITTDSATSFVVERGILVGSASWFLFLASRLWVHRHRIMGGASFALTAMATLAQPGIGPGTVPAASFDYVATVSAVLWFVILAGVLATLAWRERRLEAA